MRRFEATSLVSSDLDGFFSLVKRPPRRPTARRPESKKPRGVPASRWSFEPAASAAGTTRFACPPPVLGARGTRRRATPRRWCERAAARAPLPRAALRVKASRSPSRRGIDRRPKTYSQVGAFFQSHLARETLVGGRSRLSKRSCRRAVPALYSSPTLAAWMMSLEQTLIFSRTGPSLNGWELTRNDFVILALTRTRRLFPRFARSTEMREGRGLWDKVT